MENNNPNIYIEKYFALKKSNLNKIKNDALIKFYSDISRKILKGDRISLNCILEFLVIKCKIIDLNEIKDTLKKLNREYLNIIADSKDLYSYKKMKNNISNLKDEEIQQFLSPLVKVLDNTDVDYNSYKENIILSIEKEESDILNQINGLTYEYEEYENSKIYIYKNGLILYITNENNNIELKYNLYNKEYIKEIKKLLKSDKEIVFKYFKEIMLSVSIPDIVKDAIKLKEEIIINNEKIGEIIIKRNIRNEYEYFIKCDKLNTYFEDFNIFISLEDYEFNKIKKSHLNNLEKAIEKFHNIQDKFYNALLNDILNICMMWDERDKNNNRITIEYMKKNLSIDLVFNMSNLNRIDIEAYLMSDKKNEDMLLGEHVIVGYYDLKTNECNFNLEG